MERKIETIDSKEEWEDFFKGVKPHTFLQSWNWGEFNKKIGSKIFRIGIKDQSGGMVGIALVLKIEAKRGSFLFIPHGPIVMDKSRSPEALADKRQEFCKNYLGI